MKICYHLFTFIVPNLYEVFFFLFTNVGNQIVADSHGGKKILWKSMATVNYLVANILKTNDGISFLGELWL